MAIIVLASHNNQPVQNLVKSWGEKACLLTPQHLSQKGWYFNSNNCQAGEWVMNEQIFPNAEIDAVLTYIPRVFTFDLPQIVESDRPYVAQEMTAFLLAWLTQLSCPVVNQPTPSCLMGKNWRWHHWLYLATKLGIGIKQTAIDTQIPQKWSDYRASALETALKITVIGDYLIGSNNDILLNQARQIAQTANTEILTVYFTSDKNDAQFLGADLGIDLENELVINHLDQFFQQQIALSST
jgi:hypothetical protein